jgi:transposase
MERQFTKAQFIGQDLYVGIDVHLKSWSVSIMTENLQLKTFTQPPSVKVLKDYLTRNYPQGTYYSAYEAGFSGFSIHRELQKSGIQNIVVNPADIPITDKEKRQKEDKRDSKKIADSLRSNQLEGIYVPKKRTEELRTLIKCRSNIVKDLNRNKLRIKSLLYYYGVEIPEMYYHKSKAFSKAYVNWLKELTFETEEGDYSLKKMIKITEYLREELLEINGKIRNVAREGDYKEQISLLVKIPGIGLITAINLIATIEDINRFKRSDELYSYVGLIPSTNSSGEKDKVGHMTPRCNKTLRSLLVESAWIAARRDPALTLAYEKLVKRMKPSKAIIRIAKKLLNRVRFVLKNQVEYTIGVAI